MQRHVIMAVLRRELASYFASPTGYVFITIFIFLSAFAAFWLPEFFDRNLANLDQLNRWFPLLLIFLVPAITMGAWAEERKQGTEELLLTLPARDHELVLGKYLACLAIYTVALLFSVSHVLVLWYLGKPDPGVLFSTYLGHFLAGAALIAVGLIGSTLTGNLTIAFITSALLCAGVLALGSLDRLIPGLVSADLARALSFTERFADFGRGVVTLENVCFFLAIAAVGVWLNVFLIGRRHWAGSPATRERSALGLVRAGAIAVAALSLVTILGRASVRADVTSGGQWSLSPETRALIAQISEDRPVLITAYVSPEMPSSYVPTQETLLGLLRELPRTAGAGRIAVNIVEAEPFSDAARAAQKNYNIVPRTIPPSPGDPDPRAREVFLGLAFTSGAEQHIIPFLSRGLPVEYELARSIRTVTAGNRKKVGILETEAQLFGDFDFQAFTSRPDWPIVPELRKQYEVERVPPGQAVPEDIAVLIVAQPSTLTNEHLAFVTDYVRAGRPALIIEDPLPLVNPNIATSEPRGGHRNPFQQQPPNEDPKADLRPLYDLLGVVPPKASVVWDAYNPRPALGDLPREFLFIGRASGTREPFNDADPITRELQEVVMMCAGDVQPAPGAATTFTPLLRTSPVAGFVAYSEVLQKTFFGPGGFNPNRRLVRDPEGAIIVGARVTGKPSGGENAVSAILIPDLDMISEVFFNIRAEGFQDLEFDNVSFILNAVDVLAGDESLVDLRRPRAAHRTLTRLDETRKREEREMLEAQDAATQRAEAELAEARARMQEKVNEIDQRQDLDQTTKAIMKQAVQSAEQRRLDARSAGIEEKKQAEIDDARARSRRDIDSVQMRIRLAAVLLPPIPALALAGFVFASRRAREREGVASERLRGG